MPSMVQLPELVKPEVSGLKAIDRPVESGGLSSFLSDVLPKVMDGYDAYQKENRDHQIALGRADELNNIQRDVSALDSHNYNQGKEFQKVTSTQAQQQQQFRETVTAMAKDGKSADEIFAAGKDYLVGYTNSVYHSKLTPDLKEALYNAGIKENAAYQSLIPKVLHEVAVQREQFDSQTRVTNTYQLLREQNNTPAQTVDLLEAHIQKAYAAKIAMDVSGDPAQAMTAAQNEVQSMFKFWAGQIDPSDPNAGKFVNNLRNTLDQAVSGGVVSMQSMIDIQDTMNKTRTSILEYNSVQAENSLKEGMWNIQSGQSDYSNEFVQKQLGGINKLELEGSITPQKAAQMRNDLYSFGETQYNKLLQAQLDPAQLVQNGVSLQEFTALGKGGEAQYSDQLVQYYEGQFNGDPVGSGNAMVAHALRGDPHGERLDTLMSYGTRKLASQFTSFLSLPAATAQQMPNYQNAYNAYETLKGTYNKLRAQGSPLADQLLAGIPDEQRGIVMDMFIGGASMNSAAQALGNPTQTNQKLTNVKQAITAMTWDNIGGNKWFGRGVGGGSRVFSGISEDVRGSYVNNIQMVYEDSKHSLSGAATSANPELMVANAQALGMHVKSPAGYNDALFTADAAKVYNNVTYKGVKLSRDYVGSATDELRTQIAKQAKTLPDNVLIYSSKNGDHIIVQPFDKDGKLMMDATGDAYQGVVFNKAQFIKKMQTAYDNDQTKFKSNQSVFTTIGQAFSSKGFADTVGSTLNYKADMAARREQDRAQAQSFTVNKEGMIGQTVVGNTNVKVPAMTAVPFNGNVVLANAWQNYLNNYEGFNSQIKVIKGTGTDSDGLIIGNGVNLYAHPTLKAKAQAAQGNPQAILKVQAEFMAENMRDQQAVAKSLGIPVATTAPYNPRFTSAQLLLADYKWHNGNYNAISDIMKQPTYAQALAKMRTSAAYTHADEGHRRNVARRNMLRDYFIATGKL